MNRTPPGSLHRWLAALVGAASVVAVPARMAFAQSCSDGYLYCSAGWCCPQGPGGATDVCCNDNPESTGCTSNGICSGSSNNTSSGNSSGGTCTTTGSSSSSSTSSSSSSSSASSSAGGLSLLGGTLGTFSAGDPGSGTTILVDQGLEYVAPTCVGTTCLYGGLTPQE